MDIKKILLPVDFGDISVHVGEQAVALARHFHSEIVLLHVVTLSTYIAGSLEGGFIPELLDRATEEGRKRLDQFTVAGLEDLAVRRLLLKGDAAAGIIQTAHNEHVNLIMTPTHGYGRFRRFILGSVTAKVLHDSEFPVWTGAHLEQAPAGQFAIRNILCAVDLSAHSRNTLCWAAQMAAEFRARLTVAHITPGLELFSPKGVYAAPEWREELISSAARGIAKLQREMGTNADVFVDCGDVASLLRSAAEQTKADLLVIGRSPSKGRLRTNAYAIIRESAVPVLSV